MDTQYKHPAIIATGIAALALIISIVVAGSAYRSRNIQSINVTGTASTVITSDVVVWSGNVSRTVGPDGLRDGNTALKNDTQAVLTYMKQYGINTDKVELDPLSINQNYTYSNDKYGGSSQIFTGYTLTQNFRIQSTDLATISKAVSNSSNLINQGIFFQSNTPQYFYSKLGDLKVQLINDATKDAYTRAKAVAANAGTSVSDLRNATVGVIQITPENSSDISAEGMYDTTSVKKEVTVVVHASFFVK